MSRLILDRGTICKWVLFALLLITLLLCVVLCFTGSEVFWYSDGPSGYFDVTSLIDHGLLFSAAEILSIGSVFLAWVSMLIFLPYQVGLLLLPVFMMFGWFLMHRNVDAGKSILMTMLILSAVLAALFAVPGLFIMFLSETFLHALLQELFYLVLFAVPIGEILLFRCWQQY